MQTCEERAASHVATYILYVGRFVNDTRSNYLNQNPSIMTTSRSRRYLKSTRADKKCTRHYINVCKASGFDPEYSLVDKLKIKKGGKHRLEVFHNNFLTKF